MENLGKGFVYIIALVWAGTEVILYAMEGHLFLLLAAFAVFTIGFVVVGCYPLPDSTIDRLGKQFFALVAVTCLIFAFGSFANPLLGIFKVICAALLCALVYKFPAPATSGASGGHHH